MRKISGLLLAAAVVFLISGCSFYVGSGIAVETEFDLNGFTSVDARAASEVTVVKGDEYSVTVTSDDNIVDYLDISVSGDTLLISRKPGITFGNTIFKTEVVMPELSSLRISEASDLMASGFQPSDTLVIDVSGAGKGNISLISAGNITAIVREAGNLVVSSLTPAADLDITCTSAAAADFRNCVSDNVRVDVAGAGKAWVNLIGELSGSIVEASKLYYKGTPTVADVSVNTAASISTY
ncbi:MAG: DUF2807 domain-containing protein [Spirochaetales bacterium]|nr:DUF2807 domain-containing protein [Spirochaetales bacterium]